MSIDQMRLAYCQAQVERWQAAADERLKAEAQAEQALCDLEAQGHKTSQWKLAMAAARHEEAQRITRLGLAYLEEWQRATEVAGRTP